MSTARELIKQIIAEITRQTLISVFSVAPWDPHVEWREFSVKIRVENRKTELLHLRQTRYDYQKEAQTIEKIKTPS